MVLQPRHQCLIYAGAPSQKLPLLASIIKSRLEEGYKCLYLNSALMVSGVGSTLSTIGIDVVSEIEKGRLVLSSEPVTTHGAFNVDEMLNELEELLNQALNDGYRGLWASGDMTWEFGPEQDFSKLMEYETKLEELFGRREEFCGICQYHKDTLPDEVTRLGLQLHQGIVINETLLRFNPLYLKQASAANLQTADQVDAMITAICSM